MTPSPEAGAPPVATVRTLLAALAFAVGILAADLVHPGPGAALGAGVGGVVLLALVWAVHRRGPRPAEGDLVPSLGPRRAAVVAVGLAAVGFAALALRAGPDAGRRWVPRLGAQLTGVVADEPAGSGRATRFILRTGTVGGERQRMRVAVRVFGGGPRLRLGDRVALTTTLSPLDPDDPFDARLRRRRVEARATADARAVRLLRHSPNPVVRLSNAFRERTGAAARRALAPADAGLLLGFTIGDESGIPERIREDFRTAGLSHLTAVSGSNVAAVVAAAVGIAAALRAPRRVRVAAGLAAVGIFAVVTRWEPSVMRATVMAALVLGAFVAGRRAEGLHGLGVAVVALLAVDPFLLWAPGFQLSCAATGGILLLAPRLVAGLSRWPRPLARGAAVAVAAQVAVLPLLVVHFRSVPLAGVPANLVALPLVTPAMVIGLAGGVVAAAAPAAAVPVMWLAGIPTAAVRRTAAWFAALPYASVPLEPPVLWAVCGLVALGWGARAVLRRRQRGDLVTAPRSSRPRLRRPAVLLLAVGIAAGACGTWLFRRPPPPGGLRTTFFDVGQGESALIESPGGTRILVDGGPEPGVVAAHLARRGFRRLDVVVFSHDHADHVAGLPAVLRAFDIRAALAPLPPRDGSAPAPVRPVHPREGDRIVAGDVVVDVLGPTEPLLAAARRRGAAPPAPGEGSPVNDASLVLRVTWGRSCQLFTGDIEEAAQRVLLERHRRDIRCSLLKAPHHGSGRLVAAFVRAVDPEVVAVSVGRNAYGHPAPSALAMFRSAGASVLRTDRLGDVVVEMDRAGGVRVVR